MSKTFSDSDLRDVAREFGLGVKVLSAVIDVESGGSGFVQGGTEVKILLEAHHVWKRLLLRKINPIPFRSACPQCCQLTWNAGKQFYNVNSWKRIHTGLDWASNNRPNQFESYKKALYESCSWGLPQIMGWHYANLGYANIYAMKNDFESGEAAQVKAMMRFLQKNNLLRHLQAISADPTNRGQHWASFARGYNGSGQVAVYSRKLELAYQHAR